MEDIFRLSVRGKVLDHQRVREMGLETGERIGKEKQARERGQERFYRNIIAHSSFLSSSLSSENIILGQDPYALCCLLIIPFQLLHENPVHGSACGGAEFRVPVAKPRGTLGQHLHLQDRLLGRCIVPHQPMFPCT